MSTLRQREGAPDSRYAVPGLSDAAQALDQSALWDRIESYIAYRWGERSVAWIVEGDGEWIAPLTPATVTEVLRWTGSGYETAKLLDTPLGYFFEPGSYQITATVGSTDTPPADVVEAFRRLAEYLADDYDMGDVASRASIDLGNGLQASYDRPSAWQAKALQYSGAADLLRRYRRA